MSFVRWIPTILGFPLGGWLAIQLSGPNAGPLSAALTGLTVGTVIGAVQWLALGRAVGWRWLVGSVVGMAVGGAIAAIATGSGTSVMALIATGLISGTLVGAAQGLALRRGLLVALVWTATVGIAWAIGWLVTANVIVDAESGYAIFGLSGALVVTVITGLVLRRLIGPTQKRTASENPSFVQRPVGEPVR